MQEQVEKYLNRVAQEERDAKEAAMGNAARKEREGREKILTELGIVRREYAKDGKSSAEYPLYDSQASNWYKNVPLEVSEEEWNAIQNAYERQKKNTAAPENPQAKATNAKQLNSTTIKLLLIIAMACFILPFVTVSCSGQKATFSGMALATKTSFDQKTNSYLEDRRPNTYLFIALVLNTTGLVACTEWNTHKNKMLTATFCAGGAALFILLFRFMFVDFYELGEDAQYLDIRFEVGWTLSLLADIGAALVGACLHAITLDLKETDTASENARALAASVKEVVQQGTNKTTPPESSRAMVRPIPDASSGGAYCFCPVCDARQESGRKGCANCGVQFKTDGGQSVRGLQKEFEKGG